MFAPNVFTAHSMVFPVSEKQSYVKCVESNVYGKRNVCVYVPDLIDNVDDKHHSSVYRSELEKVRKALGENRLVMTPLQDIEFDMGLGLYYSMDSILDYNSLNVPQSMFGRTSEQSEKLYEFLELN